MSLNKGLIGHWTMDDRDTDGSTLRDRSAYDNHGTINGSPVSVSGQVNEAYTFDGSSTFIDTPFDGTEFGTFSVSVWINTNTLSEEQYIVDNSSGNSGYGFRIQNASDDIQFFTYSTPGGSASVVDSSPINSNEWIHVVAVHTTSSNDIYINGIIDGSSSTSENVASSTNMNIGSNINDSQIFNGEIDDLRFYNRALSESEINQLYQMRSLRTQRDDLSKGLVGHWTMDDADTEGSTLRDSSAYGNDCTNTNITESQSSIIGESYSFNGTDSYLTTQEFDYISDGISGEYTYSVWVNFNSLTGDKWIMGDEQNGNGGVMMQYKNTSNSVANYSGGSYQSTGHTPSTNEWEHYCFVQDSNGVSFSVNGSSLTNFMTGTNTDVSEYISIGAFGIASSLDNRFMDGKLSDIRVYNRALTDSEINRLYNKRQ